MKKKIPIIFFTVFITIFILCIISNKNNSKSVFLEQENTIYNIYHIKLDNITLNKYKNIFNNIDPKKYKILNFKFINNYNKKLTSEINRIKIENGHYLEAIDEYVNEYLKVLNKYNIESEISKVKNANMLIEEITIYTTIDIYTQIKKDANAS